MTALRIQATMTPGEWIMWRKIFLGSVVVAGVLARAAGPCEGHFTDAEADAELARLESSWFVAEDGLELLVSLERTMVYLDHQEGLPTAPFDRNHSRVRNGSEFLQSEWERLHAMTPEQRETCLSRANGHPKEFQFREVLSAAHLSFDEYLDAPVNQRRLAGRWQ